MQIDAMNPALGGRIPISLLCGMLFLSLLFLVSPSRAELRIAEMLSAPGQDWNGDGDVNFKTDEWVEIVNTGPDVESLDGVFLRDGTGDTYHFGFSGSLAPQEALVVYGSDSVEWQAANDAGSSGLSLNNSGDTLELWRDIEAPRVLEPLDVVSIPAHAAAVDRTMGLDLLTGTWRLHDALLPYAGDVEPTGTGCEPSPGILNACRGLVPTESLGWGALKGQFTLR